MRANYKMQRLFIDAPLKMGEIIALSREQAHYLTRVLRMEKGALLLVFNGRDGEWQAELFETQKKQVSIRLIKEERAQPEASCLIYCFAPLKHARLDYMMQKAVEMGASVLQPVITQYTQATRLNEERMTANVIEAAEQCGILTIPQCCPPLSLQKMLDMWEIKVPLIFCDEAAQDDNPLPILNRLEKGACGLLIGPEGGFSDDERKLLLSFPFVTQIPLGPRILRADTAAVAALALIGATVGDW